MATIDATTVPVMTRVFRSRLVATAAARHETAPTATAALGRTLMGALLMAAENGPGETLQIQLRGDGPLGALSVPVRGKVSVAADPSFVPLGAPVWLDLDRKEANGLWVAQDTGGAIKGANRFDTFWGAGDSARQTAGGMSGRGQALILLPRGVLTRIGAI